MGEVIGQEQDIRLGIPVAVAVCLADDAQLPRRPHRCTKMFVFDM